MGTKLNKSQVPESIVRRTIDRRIGSFVALTGKNPTHEQREVMKKEVIDAAKRVNRDRGI